MTIWFDLTNSPHINFFRQLIGELQQEGHRVIITCRPLANTIDLLDLYHMEYTVIGKHYGKSIWKKALGFPIRVWELYQFIKNKNIDIGISQSSFYSPIAGYLAKIPTIYTNDNEHAAGNKISFLFAKKILVPEFIPKRNITNLFVKESKIYQYPGVKEGIYLWKKYKNVSYPTATADKIFVRTEPQTAQYYSGQSNFLDEIIKDLKGDYQIVILPRNVDQINHYSKPEFKGITICKKPMQLEDIAKECLLFIGAGGTMTREMAVIGVPTVSVYQDSLLAVDEFLIKQNVMKHDPNLTTSKVRQLILSIQSKSSDMEILEKGEQAYKLLKELLISTKS